MLEAVGVVATFYVNTLPLRGEADPSAITSYYDRIRHFGDRTCLSRDEIRAIADAGHTIGCHSHSHFNLATLAPERWEDEILRSRQILESLIAAPVAHFSYPFGMRRHFSEELKDYCFGNGFRTISAAAPCLQHAPVADPYIHRSGWKLTHACGDNVQRVSIDGRLFYALTGRSAVG